MTVPRVNDCDQINEGPGEHDTHLRDDDPADTVACPRCGKHIWTYAQRCQCCGVHFSGQAWQFNLAGAPVHHTGSRWLILILIVALAMLLLIAFWQ